MAGIATGAIKRRFTEPGQVKVLTTQLTTIKSPLASKTSNYNILRRVCWLMKICGLGDYWHETSDDNSDWYRWFTGIIFLQIMTMTLLQVLEALLNTYPADLHNDAVYLGWANILVIFRLAVVIRAKDKIRDFHKHVIEDCKSFEDEGTMKQQYRKIKIALTWQTCSIYIYGVLYWYEGFSRMLRKNLPFFVLVVYWPAYEDTSNVALAARIAMGLTILLLITAVISIENLVVTHFILMNYKLKNLTRRFENIREEFLATNTSTDEFKETILDGIILYNKVVSSARKMQDCFGYMMSIQPMQGSAITVLVLLRLALSNDYNIAALLLNFLGLGIIMTQLILYMWNAGDITYQALLIGDAIFYSGWERRGARTQAERELRRVVLMGIAQAQRPLVLKAFGVQELSYSSFVSVVRATYSLFAVMHSTKKS